MAAAGDVRENVKKYYGGRLESSCDLQTSAASCSRPLKPLPPSVSRALDLVHPDVQKRFFGCGLPFPARLDGCRVLDLGSGSGRDCFAFSKLVGASGHVTGIDMTEELVSMSRQYIHHHQTLFGFEQPNVSFVVGLMENLGAAGLQPGSMDVVLSNCVICLCPDKKAVLQQAHTVLKEGGELFFSDMFADQVVPDHLKDDATLWSEGMSGCLFWKDLLPLAEEAGFSRPRLVSASHIKVFNQELRERAGDISYASGTYRLFKLPAAAARLGSKASVTYKGTVSDFPHELDFDSSHCFQRGVASEVDAETAAALRSSRFSSDFDVEAMEGAEPEFQICRLSPFLLADKLGSCVKQQSKSCKSSCD